MKKVSVMVVVALMSASMFANGANLPTKTTKGTPAKTEVKHKQDKAKTKSKDKGAAKAKKAGKKESKQPKGKQSKV